MRILIFVLLLAMGLVVLVAWRFAGARTELDGGFPRPRGKAFVRAELGAEVGFRTYEEAGRSVRTRGERERLLREILGKPKLSRYSGEGLKELFEAWFETDPVGALKAAESIDDPRFLYTALCAGVAAFVHAPDELDGQASALLDPVALDQFRHMMLAEVGRRDPAAGLELIGFFAGDPEPYFQAIVESWIEEDPRAAAQALVEYGDPDHVRLMQRLGSLGPGSFDFDDVAWAKEQDFPPRYVSSMAYDALGRAIHEKGMAEALDQIGRSELSDAFKAGVAGVGPTVDPEGFVEIFDAIEKMGFLDAEGDVGIATHRLYYESPPLAFEFFDRARESPEKGAWVAEELSRNLIAKNVNEAAQWIGSFERGTIRDAAIHPLLDYLQQHDETKSAVEWRQLLSEGGAE